MSSRQPFITEVQSPLQLDLTVAHDWENEYIVTAFSSNSLSATSRADLNPDSWSLSFSVDKSAQSDPAFARETGQSLFNVLFTRNTKSLYAKLYQTAADANSKLHINLTVDEKLGDLPWELLYDDSAFPGSFLSLSPNISMCRQVPRSERTAGTNNPDLNLIPPRRTHETTDNGATLKQALIMANPVDAVRFDAVQEASAHQGSMKTLVEEGDLSASIHSSTTIETVALHPELRNCDVLCFVGHASLNEHGTEGRLVLEKRDGSSDPVTGKVLVDSMHGHAPSLIVLQCCASAKPNEWQALKIVARDMILAGASSVLYLQFPTNPNVFNGFLSEFHHAAIGGASIRDSVSMARRRLALAGYTPDWASPVLLQPLKIIDIQESQDGTDTPDDESLAAPRSSSVASELEALVEVEAETRIARSRFGGFIAKDIDATRSQESSSLSHTWSAVRTYLASSIPQMREIEEYDVARLFVPSESHMATRSEPWLISKPSSSAPSLFKQALSILDLTSVRSLTSRFLIRHADPSPTKVGLDYKEGVVISSQRSVAETRLPTELERLGIETDTPIEPVIVHRYVQTDFPEIVEINNWYELIIEIQCSPSSASDTEVNIRVMPERVEPTLIDVRVIAPGFTVEGNRQIAVPIPAQVNADPVIFRLMPMEAGTKEIKIVLSQLGRHLGMICVICDAFEGSSHESENRLSL